jgi:hypothetical protein
MEKNGEITITGTKITLQSAGPVRINGTPVRINGSKVLQN